MRILPICLYGIEREKRICTSENEAIYAIHAASALTHAHPRSQIACGIYYYIVKAIIQQKSPLVENIQNGIDQAFSFYIQDSKNVQELKQYNRIRKISEYKILSRAEIKSSGYVVDTLEASIWCLLNTNSYQAAVLMAVNLGEDTDTVGAVTGSLAGLYYGYKNIPSEWINVLQKKEWIECMCHKMDEIF